MTEKAPVSSDDQSINSNGDTDLSNPQDSAESEPMVDPVSGLPYEVNSDGSITCPQCGGSGKVPQDKLTPNLTFGVSVGVATGLGYVPMMDKNKELAPCPVCGGSGKLRDAAKAK